MTSRPARQLVAFALAVAPLFPARLVQPPASPPPAKPVEPIGAIADAFRTYSVVTINGHGTHQVLAFTLALVRDRRISDVVNDIVIEDGNALYQNVVDRYVGGEDVPYDELRHAWENTTQSQIVTPRSGYVPELYRAVRDVNASLPRDRWLRVLLGDPPIDWQAVKAPADKTRWMNLRDSYPAALLQVEVLARNRRALVVYGQMHSQRQQVASNYDMNIWAAHTIVSILERTTPTKVFTIWWETELEKLQPDVRSWPVPSLAVVRGTVLGAADFVEYSEWPSRVSVREDGVFVPVPRDAWRARPMEQQFDAVLYLGPASRMTTAPPLTPAVCGDPAYVEMRVRRMETGGAPAGFATKLKEYCANVRP